MTSTGRLSGAAPGGRLVDAVIVGLAGWTVVFHLALVLGWTRTPTMVVAGLVCGPLALAVALGQERPIDPTGDEPAAAADRPDRAHLVYVGVAGLVAAATTVVRPSGGGFAAVWLAMLALAVAAVWLIRSGGSSLRPDVRDLPRWTIWLVAGLAALAALGVVRQDLDDVELINRSLYVEQHAGPFPTRDTVIADEVFASDRPETPATSIEPLIGVIAVVVPVSATTVAHLWVAPLVMALAVLAMHRLLVTARAPAPVLVTTAASAWLLLDGEVLRSIGNHGIPRAWQGKVILLVVVVPALWHHLLRWLREGDRSSLAIATACGIAAVGLSRTGTFLPVLIVVTVALAALVADLGRRIPGVVIAAAYPVVAGVAGVVAERAPTAPRGLLAATQPVVLLPNTDPAQPWYSVLGRGVGFAVACFAVLTAWAWVGDRLTAAALAIVPAIVALAVSTPGAAVRVDEVTGSNSILWRSVWAIPVAAGIGLALVAAPRLLPRPRVAAVAVPLALAGAFVADGVWIASSENRGASIEWPPAWKVDADDLVAAERLIDLTDPGRLVAAPVGVSGTLGTITLDIRAVAPRDDSLKGRIVVPELLADERRSLTFSLTTGTLDAIATDLARTALVELDVATVCSRPDIDPENPLLGLLFDLGYDEIERDEHCVYWTRP
ncbi:MAG: DUF6077 domain-containing protein [Actinomycetota bacterium]